MEIAKTIKVNSGKEPNAELGPVISKQVFTWSASHLSDSGKFLNHSASVTDLFC